MSKGRIGVDLDGTLAYYDEWRGLEHIGEPIPTMVSKVKEALRNNEDVTIFTARVAPPNDAARARSIIERWCEKHIGQRLPVTCVKDFTFKEIWDDRCRQVYPNTGVFVEEALSGKVNFSIDQSATD